MAETSQPETPVAEGATDGQAAEPTTAAPAAAEPGPTARQQQIERDALADATSRRARREADVARATRVDRYGDALELLEKGETRAAMRKLLGEKYTPQTVLELTQDFPDPEQLSVEERVDRAVNAKEEARQAAERERENAKTREAMERADGQIDTFIGEAAAYLKEHIADYPGLEVYNVTGEEVEAKLLDHFHKTGETIDPKTALDLLEVEKFARLKRTRFAPKAPAAASDGDPEGLDDTPRLRQPTPGVLTRKLTLEEQVERDMQEHDNRERATLRRRGAT